MKANVYDTVEFKPKKRVYFNKIEEYPATKTVTLINKSDKPFKIKRIATRRPGYDVSYETIEEGMKYKLTVTVKEPGGRYPRTVGYARIMTTREKNSQLKMRIIYPGERKKSPKNQRN